MEYNNANTLKTFMELTEKNKIVAQNKALTDNLNNINSVLDFTKESNNRLMNDYVNELERVSKMDIMEKGLELSEEVSKVAVSDGITAGASKMRVIQTIASKTSKALGGIKAGTESAISKARQRLDADNINLEAQRLNAYNDVRNKIISGPLAALQIQIAGQQGYQQGLQKDVAIEETKKYQ